MINNNNHPDNQFIGWDSGVKWYEPNQPEQVTDRSAENGHEVTRLQFLAGIALGAATIFGGYRGSQVDWKHDGTPPPPPTASIPLKPGH